MIDPVTLAVITGRLEQVVDEMDATLFRSSFNPIVAEAHDASHGIYHPDTGDTLVQGKAGLPIFVGAMMFAVRYAMERAEQDGGAKDGDVYLFNDPYKGATHLNDYKLVRPVFRDGKLFCWLASVAHWSDVGGNVPGNYNPAAVDSHQEGVRIPPVKLCDAGEMHQDVVDILLANSRLPVSAYGDLMGQTNALDLGVTRLGALLDEYGDDTVRAAMEELTARAEKLMRANISDLPDGTYSCEDFLDNDGIVDEPLKIALDLTVKGDTLELDFTRSATGCAGPVNISHATTIACCYVALKHVFRDVPASAGCLAPVSFKIPEQSILNAGPPKPVGGYTETILRVIDTVFRAMAQVAPGIVGAPAYGTINALTLSGHRGDGSPWIMFSFFGGGLGGNPEGDGLSHGNAPISTAVIPPVEVLEAANPVYFTQWSLRADSGGPGKRRGGLGAVYEVELLGDSARASLFADRGKYPPPGVVGGGPGAANRFFYPAENGDGTEVSPPLVSKIVGVTLSRGQRVRIESPGGGGYGAATEREPELIARDVAMGLVTREAAERDYGVTVSADGAVTRKGEAR